MPGEARDRSLGDLSLIKTQPRNRLTVRRKLKRARKLELLFIYPIGMAVNDLIQTSVACNAMQFPGRKIDIIYVILAYKGDPPTIGRECCLLLTSLVSKPLERTRCNIINPMRGPR